MSWFWFFGFFFSTIWFITEHLVERKTIGRDWDGDTVIFRILCGVVWPITWTHKLFLAIQTAHKVSAGNKK